ncbi:MAG: hypothetical protein JO272_00230 [Pseudonocardiales bacterium]|nr:hypothetical protein [Pseudonocardiales bacterium]
MRRSSEPEERAQFTVAELVARYGGAAPSTGRRHRRAAEDADAAVGPAGGETAAQPVVERDWGAPREPEVRSAEPRLSEPRLSEPRLSEPLSVPDLPLRNGVPHADPRRDGRAGRAWAPAVGPSSVPARPAPVTPTLAARRAPPGWAALPDGPVTEQLPRLSPISADPLSADRPANPTTWPNRPPVSAPQNENAAEETQSPESGSPLWEWAVMVGQVGIGVLGGAALWLICEWLWQRIPVVALVVALVVITGLVWVVRRVRCAEDLQTTVIAVLVGLFVTVSPAALLLVGR